MPVKFINITEKEFLQKKLLHKNCSLEHCLDILDQQHMWFANPTTWQDPFESMFLTAKYKLSSGKTSHHPWHQRVFCTCMTEKAACEAYWKIYSQQQIGISLAINRDVLLDELRKYSVRTKTTIFIGKVEYQKSSVITNNLKSNPFIKDYLTTAGIRTEEAKVRLLLLKRSSFDYENEIRFFIIKKEKTLLPGISFDYSCPPTKLIKTITIDPNVQKYVFTLIKDKLVNHYHFYNFPSSETRVKKSLLYTTPKTKTFTI